MPNRSGVYALSFWNVYSIVEPYRMEPQTTSENEKQDVPRLLNKLLEEEVSQSSYRARKEEVSQSSYTRWCVAVLNARAETLVCLEAASKQKCHQ